MEEQMISLRKDFYRDGFRKILFVLGVFIVTIILLIATSFYLFLDKPAPVTFSTDNEWRILKPVPLEQPYLTQPDLIQWVSQAVSGLFSYDFIDYKNELERNEHYFTDEGWKKFLTLLNIYADYTAITNTKLFINSSADGAPFILNQGLLDRKYSWWVQMPVKINYSNGYNQQILQLQVLVVRVPTLDNLYGVAIDNIIAPSGPKPFESKVVSNE